MGVNTLSYLESNPSIEVLENSLKKIFKNVKLTDLKQNYENNSKAYYLVFEHFNKITKEVEKRDIFVLTNNIEKNKDSLMENYLKKPYVYLSLGMWGDSVKIMKEILKIHGGYLISDDCKDEDSKNYCEKIEKIKSKEELLNEKSLLKELRKIKNNNFENIECSFGY